MADVVIDLRGTLDFSGAPPPSTVDWFVFLAQWFWLIWLRPDSKLPAFKGTLESGTRDEQRIRAMLHDPVMDAPLGRNVGALAWRFGEGFAAVIDVDVRDGKPGAETFAQLQRDGLIGRPLMTTRTASGGLHLWYRVERPLRSGANLLGPGVDVKSAGGYVVMPGSIIGGRCYTVEGHS